MEHQDVQSDFDFSPVLTHLSNGGSTIFITSDTFTIGRAKESSLCIPSMILSRKQCAIKRDENFRNWMLTSENSKASTWINDTVVPCGFSVALKDGDIIKLSSDKFLFKFWLIQHQYVANKKRSLQIMTSFNNILMSPPYKKLKLEIESAHLGIKTDKDKDKVEDEDGNSEGASRESDWTETDKYSANHSSNHLQNSDADLLKSGCLDKVVSTSVEKTDPLLKIELDKLRIEKECLNNRVSDLTNNISELEQKLLDGKVSAEHNLKKESEKYESTIKDLKIILIENNLKQEEVALQIEELKKECADLNKKLKAKELDMSFSTATWETTTKNLKLQIEEINSALLKKTAELDKCTVELEKYRREDAVGKSGNAVEAYNNGINHVTKLVVNMLESDLQCSICGELFIEPVLTECRHTFCMYCIQTWSKKTQKCPICRSTINLFAKPLALEEFINQITEKVATDLKEQRNSIIKERENKKKADLEAAAGLLNSVFNRAGATKFRSIRAHVVLQDIRDQRSPAPAARGATESESAGAERNIDARTSMESINTARANRPRTRSTSVAIQHLNNTTYINLNTN